MTRTELATASETLASAAHDASGDATEALSDLADQLESLAEADRGPDHGRLARIEAKLDDVQPDVSDAVATSIDDALDSIHDYRETLDGV
jgi:hypothetical protein